MNNKQLFFVINPSAGKGEAVVEKIRQVFDNSGQHPLVHVLKPNEDAAKIVRSAVKKAELIAVYGGDGSITEAAAGLIGSSTPLAIIPGGTANVLSKELGIPQDTDEVLKALRDGKYIFKTIDTGLVNGRPFLLRVNLGIMAEMITDVDPELKNEVGQLAYGLAAIKSVYDTKLVDYHFEIDGQQVFATGVALTITNSGSMGIGNLQMQPGISVSDGFLDVVLLKDAAVLSIIKAAGASLFDKETDAILHWKCKEVTVTLPKQMQYLCDDCEGEARTLKIKIVPLSLTVAIPLTD